MSGYEEISYSKQHKKQKNMLFFKQRQTNNIFKSLTVR